MFRVLFHRFGIIAFRSTRSDVSLIIIGFWNLFVVAYSPATRFVDVALCRRSRNI